MGATSERYDTPRCNAVGHLNANAPLVGDGLALGTLIGLILRESGAMLVGSYHRRGRSVERQLAPRKATCTGAARPLSRSSAVGPPISMERLMTCRLPGHL